MDEHSCHLSQPKQQDQLGCIAAWSWRCRLNFAAFVSGRSCDDVVFRADKMFLLTELCDLGGNLPPTIETHARSHCGSATRELLGGKLPHA